MAQVLKKVPKSFQNDVNNLIDDKRKLNLLLNQEKKRRGLNKEDIVFIGIANVAGFWWCAIRSLLTSKIMETSFFASYLYDRLIYSYELGMIRAVPKTKEDILLVGNEISLKDINYLLAAKKSENAYSAEESSFLGNLFELVSEPTPKNIGIAEHIRRTTYCSTIRWNFQWGKLVLLGVPDGLKKTVVYEFKTSGKRYLFRFVKPVAEAQAEIYGYFFKRKKVSIEFLFLDENTKKVISHTIDKSKVESTLRSFLSMLNGELPIPPREWKCENCSYKPICPVVTNTDFDPKHYNFTEFKENRSKDRQKILTWSKNLFDI